MAPPALRKRVTGTDDEQIFNASGAQTVDEWVRALGVIGETLDKFPTIADFGCGCGRALRHLQSNLAPSQRLIGLDVDAEAIDWVASAFPNVSAVRLSEPPAPIESNSVDLILSHSVFTHLPEEVQFTWFTELFRLLKVNGVLVTSIHGWRGFDEFRRHCIATGLPEKASEMDAAMRTIGYYYSPGRTDAESALPDYYGAAFHNISYIIDHWLTPGKQLIESADSASNHVMSVFGRPSEPREQTGFPKAFTLLAWLPVFALGLQDVVVLRKIAD